ncbi:MAG: UpxY family transcription antiterminator [Alphaproteobacteria bacterium]|nr:UpxY family transcription antiterminator [Alphaproteobacteria bacterium]
MSPEPGVASVREGQNQTKRVARNLPATLAWYAVYTRSRWEKKLMLMLNEKGIEAYVPLRKALHHWSDRKKLIDEPIIRSYCFVRITSRDYYEVLNTPGAVRYVWFSGKPAVIPERQIDTLKAVTGSDVPVTCIPDTFETGVRVRITAGQLIGLEGELISISNKKKVIIRIDHLNQVLTLSISPLLIERIR